MTAAQLNAMFRAYGDAGGHWTGGDSTVSVPLPDGRVAWLFSDTFLGTVAADGTRPRTSPMVNNTLVVQQGGQLTDTRHGGTPTAPAALVVPPERDQFFWVADAVVEGGKLKALYNRYERIGADNLDVAVAGTALATFSLPELTLEGVTELPLGHAVSWGSTIVEDGGFSYVFGTSTAPGGMKFAHLARAAAGELGGAWQFWDGQGWGSDPLSAARLVSGVGTNFAVQKVGAQWLLVTQENNAVFDPQIVAYTAPGLTGPFTGPTVLMTAPEQAPGKQTIVYAARLHPELAPAGKLLLSYDVNSLSNDDNYADARLYRPRFVELTWPVSQPDPAAVPRTPTGFSVTTDDAAAARLSWQAVSGATGYRVYRRAVTSGQTHFVRGWLPVTGTSTTVGGLITGQRYEFRVTAENAAGESVSTAAVEVTPRRPADRTVIEQSGSPYTVNGVYLIELKDNPASRGAGLPVFARHLIEQYGGQVKRVYGEVLWGFVATLTEPQAIALAGHPDVLAVEQDQRLRTTGEQSGPPWHLDRIDQRKPLGQDPASDGRYVYPNGGAGVRIYVIDSGVGVQRQHPQFGARLVEGQSFVGDDPADTSDCNSHGTHVAGIAAGSTYGVAKEATVVPVRVQNCTDDPLVSDTLSGVDWAGRDARVQGGPAVFNFSLGVSGVASVRLTNAVNRAIDRNVTVVAAAGNDGVSACFTSPAKIPAVITVGSADRNDVAAPRSNRGECVDLYAPGVDVVSAGITAGRAEGLPCVKAPSNPSKDASGCTLSGTSMAAPAVAGAAAIVLAAHPGWSPAQVQKALVDGATPDAVTVGAEKGALLYVGSPPPAAPTGLAATAGGDGSIGLSWNRVAGEGITYLAEMRDVTAGQTDFASTGGPVDGVSTRVRDLVVGHVYEFRVAAANAAGTGPWSAPASATARFDPPPAPRGLTAVAQGDGGIRLSWQPLDEPVYYWISQRDITAGETEFTRLQLPTEATSMTAGFLVHDHEYEFTVSASNRGGEGPASQPAKATSVYPAPAAPGGLRAVAGDGKVDLSWSASSTANVWYLVRQRDVTAGELEFTELPLPVTECCAFSAGFLANGHVYEFEVVATASGRNSAPSSPARATPQAPLPGQVTGLTATARADGTIALAWTSPPGEGLWFDIYQRDVTAGESFRKLEYPVTTCCAFTAGLLTHEHAYEFRVAALGPSGAGPQSAPASATARFAPPPAPLNLTGEAAGDGVVNLDWDPPGVGDFFYWVYLRDVTAGQSFRKIEIPTKNTSSRLEFMAANHVYEFKVSAQNAGGEGAATPVVQVTARGGVPAAPSGLSARAGDGQVTLVWNGSSTSGVQYNVYQRDVTGGQGWKKLPLPVSATTMTAGLLTNGTTYEFRVSASNASGTSGYSNVVSARPMPPRPAAPSGLTASAGDGQVTLRWSASSTPNVFYWVEMRASGGAWDRLPYPVSSCCTFTPKLLRNGVTYEFRVFANNLAGDSAASGVASARPMPPFPQPASDLTAAAGDGRVTLRWSASSTGNVQYWVEMRSKGGSWQRLPYAVACCSYTVGLLANGTTYEFRVRVSNLSGTAAATNVASARPMPPVPQAPTGMTALVRSTSSAFLSWNASPTPSVLYEVWQRNVTYGSGWEKLPYPIPGLTLEAGLLRYGLTYEFRVRASNLAGVSGFSTSSSVLIVPASHKRRCANVASNFLFNNLNQFDAIQLRDVSVTVCAERSSGSFRIESSWYSGRRMLEGIFQYDLLECGVAGPRWTGYLQYPRGTASSSESRVDWVDIDPARLYAVRARGNGATDYQGAVYTRFRSTPPSGIDPLDRTSSCF